MELLQEGPEKSGLCRSRGRGGGRRKREQSFCCKDISPFSTQCPVSGRQDQHHHHPACSLCSLPEIVLLCHFKNTFLGVTASMSSDPCPPLLWRGSGVSVGWTKRAEAGDIHLFHTDGAPTKCLHCSRCCGHSSEHNGQNPLPSWTGSCVPWDGRKMSTHTPASRWPAGSGLANGRRAGTHPLGPGASSAHLYSRRGSDPPGRTSACSTA